MSQTLVPHPTSPTNSVTDMTRGPQCGAVAQIRHRDVLQSTAGPIEHVGIICAARHTFLLPAAALDGVST